MLNINLIYFIKMIYGPQLIYCPIHIKTVLTYKSTTLLYNNKNLIILISLTVTNYFNQNKFLQLTHSKFKI